MKKILLLVAFILSSTSDTVLFAQDTLVRVYCLDRWITAKEKYPVGCELVDCCPGCPKSFVTLKFTLTSPDMQIVLTPENAENMQSYSLHTSGNITLCNNGSLIIKPGESSISGLPPDKALSYSINYCFSKKSLKKQAKRLIAAQKNKLIDEVESSFSIRKYYAEKKIGDKLIEAKFRICNFSLPDPPKLTDKIELKNKTGVEISNFLVDAKSLGGTCLNDQKQWGTTSTLYNNYLSNGVCATETIVFSKENAVAVESHTWTDSRGDVQTITLDPVLELRPVVWINSSNPLILQQTQDEISNNEKYFSISSYGGIKINPEYRIIPDDQQQSLETFSCETIDRFITSGNYMPNRLNIYYTHRVLSKPVGGMVDYVNGRSCFLTDNPEVIAIAIVMNNAQTVSHEIGHAVSLGHTNSVSGSFPADEQVNLESDNVMFAGALGSPIYGRFFTEGQYFRMHVNESSIINRLNLRVGKPVRNCPDINTDSSCISLGIKF
jgi:hypothetical protein